MEKLNKILGLVGYARPKETTEVNDKPSMQNSIYKIKITKCKICSLEKNQCLNFSNNKELKKHVIQAHRDSIYYDIAMELIQ